MTDIGELEKKAWFRFFKLCYVSVYVLSVCAVAFLSYDSLPTKYVDDWDIHCSDGRTAPTRENSIYPIDGQISPDEDSKARQLCAGPWNKYKRPALNFIPDEKNYSLVAKHATRGSYKEAGKTLFWG